MDSFRSKIIRFVVKNIASKGLSTNITPQARRARLERLSIPYYYGFKYHRTPLNVAGIPAQWISSENADQEKVMLYFHGGAYTFGSPKTHGDLAIRLSRQCGVKVLIVDYRLAPEHPYPAAVDDATQAYVWLLDQGYNPNNIVIAGDSAGGGLTMATLINLRDKGYELPAAGVCLSPWADLSCSSESMTTLDKKDPFLSAQWLQEMAKLYIGAEDAQNPLISPVFGDLKNLPPIFIQVGSDEVLLDDSTRLEKNISAAGGEVILTVYPNMWHVWQIFSAIMPEARDALMEIGGFVNSKIDKAKRLRGVRKKEAVS